MISRRQRRESAVALLLIAPSVISLLVFYFYPTVYTIYLSFLEWNLLSPTRVFVGFQNYGGLWQDLRFIKVLKNSLIFMGGTTVFTLGFGLALAVPLNRDSRVNNVFRAMYFLPYIVSWVSISLLWRWIFDLDWGLLNTVLKMLNVPKVNWLGNPRVALYSLILVMVWKTVGYDMVIFLAGLRNIPNDYYEAAEIDGATRWKSFRFITLPLLSPTILFLWVTSMISSFTAFDIIKVMTGGGPVGSTSTFVFYIYEVAFEYFKIGKASAAVLVFFAIIVGVTLLQFAGLGKRVHYER